MLDWVFGENWLTDITHVSYCLILFVRQFQVFFQKKFENQHRNKNGVSQIHYGLFQVDKSNTPSHVQRQGSQRIQY